MTQKHESVSFRRAPEEHGPGWTITADDITLHGLSDAETGYQLYSMLRSGQLHIERERLQ